jgi:hypothetical protein
MRAHRRELLATTMDMRNSLYGALSQQDHAVIVPTASQSFSVFTGTARSFKSR